VVWTGDVKEERAEGGVTAVAVRLPGYNEQRVATPDFASGPSWWPLID